MGYKSVRKAKITCFSVPKIWEHLKQIAPSWTHFRIFDDFQKNGKNACFSYVNKINVDKS